MSTKKGACQNKLGCEKPRNAKINAEATHRQKCKTHKFSSSVHQVCHLSQWICHDNWGSKLLLNVTPREREPSSVGLAAEAAPNKQTNAPDKVAGRNALTIIYVYPYMEIVQKEMYCVHSIIRSRVTQENGGLFEKCLALCFSFSDYCAKVQKSILHSRIYQIPNETPTVFCLSAPGQGTVFSPLFNFSYLASNPIFTEKQEERHGFLFSFLVWCWLSIFKIFF